jgi:hypothetical protein
LPLPGRQHGAPFADPGIVTRRQPKDHLVRAGRARSAQHRIGVGIDAHSRDVFRDRPVEQLDRLRDETEVLPENLRVPLVERGAIEAHAAFSGSPDTNESAHQ